MAIENVGPGGVRRSGGPRGVTRQIEGDVYHKKHIWSVAQAGEFYELFSESANIPIDLLVSNNFYHVLTEDTTLGLPTTIRAGQSGVIHFTQDATTAKTLAFDNFWGFGVGASKTVTTTLGGVSVMTYIVDPSATSATCSWTNKS